MAEEKDRRTPPPRRVADNDIVTFDDLEFIINKAVTQALAQYQHECIMGIGCEDVPYIRDWVNGVKEVGDGNFPKAISIIRDNHKFLSKVNKAATAVGWAVFVAGASIVSFAVLIITGIIKLKTGS